jgi:hypothetical protein
VNSASFDGPKHPDAPAGSPRQLHPIGWMAERRACGVARWSRLKTQGRFQVGTTILAHRPRYWRRRSAGLCQIMPFSAGAVMPEVNHGLAMQYLHESKIRRFRLALGSRPYKDALFLCTVPCQNLENGYNKTALECCIKAKTSWVEARSLKYKGLEAYEPVLAVDQDAYNDRLEWPTATMDEILDVTFAGKMIETPDCPGMRRLRGMRVDLVKS